MLFNTADHYATEIVMFKITNEKIIAFFKLLWKKTNKSIEISPRQAAKIQKQNYINVNRNIENICTPPYLTIAAQLADKQPAVFEAAVTYLCAIAQNEPKYQKAVIELLGAYMTNHKSKTDRIAFIENMLAQHKWSV